MLWAEGGTAWRRMWHVAGSDHLCVGHAGVVEDDLAQQREEDSELARDLQKVVLAAAVRPATASGEGVGDQAAWVRGGRNLHRGWWRWVGPRLQSA